MKSGILGILVVCLGIATAPWLSGGQEPVAMLISGLALLLGALLVQRQPEARKLRRGPLTASFALLIGFAALSLLWSANRYSSVVWIVQWGMAGLAFWLAYTIAGEARGREWAVRLYLGSAAVFCVAAIVMFLTSEYNRLTGTFYWPNPAAAYLIPAIIIAWDRLRSAVGREMWLWGAASVLFLSSFLLTDSRASTLVLGVVGIIFLLVSKVSRGFWIKFVFILALGFLLSLGISKLSTVTAQHSGAVVPGSRFAAAASGESRSLSDRFYYLGSALDMWFTHPAGGTGAGTYGDVHPQYQKRVISASTSAHNVYVQTLAELGVVGAIALAAVLFWLLAGSLKGIVSSPEAVPILLGAVGLLMHFGLDIDAGYPALLMLAAALLGLVYGQWRQVRQRASIMWAAWAVVLLIPTVSLYQSDNWAIRARAAQDDGDYPEAAARFALAHGGLVYNPDLVNAEGIDLFVVATGSGADAKKAGDLALLRARQAQKLDPSDGQHHQLEGRILAFRGDLKGAEAAFRAALVLDPWNHPDYALDLAGTQVRAGDNAGAVQTAKAMLALYPDAVVNNRNSDSTIRPELADLEALIGNVYLSEGNLTGAEQAAKSSLKYSPRSLRGQALMVQVKKLITQISQPQTPPAQ